MRKPFNFNDLCQEATLTQATHSLDGRTLGATLEVPSSLMHQFPFNCSAYDYLQFCRDAIYDYGIIEIPKLPLNKSNYTLAQKSPQEHKGNPNQYMTDSCQSLHQDTPPYPTAFWLNSPRQFYYTWITSTQGCEQFYSQQQQQPNLSIDELHRQLVPQSLADKTGIIVNQQPGLLLIDNSDRQKLYHARSCNFAAADALPNFTHDSPMYAFNEVGLMHYINDLDIYRGDNDKNATELAAVKAFIAAEQNP